jgi:arsenate reductase
MTIIYGIKNCDTVKKALKFLEENNIKFVFHDYKNSGISSEKLKEFIAKFGLEKVLNSKGKTWKQLSEDQKPKNEKEAIKLMIEKTSLIKRPIIEGKNIWLIGFDVDEYKNLK